MIMRRLFALAILLNLILMVKPLSACDQCGCSSGATFNNLSAFATYNFIMLRLGYSSMQGYGNVGSFALNTNADIVGGYSLNKRLHLSAFLPVKYNYFEHDENSHTASGIGDAGIMANYVLFSNSDKMMQRVTSTLSIRGGIELPTGNFNENFRADDVPAAISTGSGSFDFFGGLRYTIRSGNNAITVDYIGKYNTENAVAYQFGFQQSANVYVTKSFKKTNAAWLPYAGVSGEFVSGDTYHDNFMTGTKGNNVSAMAGLEYARTKWVFGAHAEFPVISAYDTDINLHPKASLRMVHLFN